MLSQYVSASAWLIFHDPREAYIIKLGPVQRQALSAGNTAANHTDKHTHWVRRFVDT